MSAPVWHQFALAIYEICSLSILCIEIHVLYKFILISTFSLIRVFNQGFITFTYLTHIAASNTVVDDVTNYIMRRIVIIFLRFFCS